MTRAELLCGLWGTLAVIPGGGEYGGLDFGVGELLTSLSLGVCSPLLALFKVEVFPTAPAVILAI